MPPSKRITCNSMTFETQKKFREYVKELIYDRICQCDDVLHTKPDEYHELLCVLRRHPNYDVKTAKMRDLSIRYDKLNKRALTIMILNTDGSETDISWVWAVRGGTPGSNSNKHDLRSVMRNSVDYQIKSFKRRAVLICETCGSRDKELHVDHIIHFEKIASDFERLIRSEGGCIPTSFEDMVDGTHRKCCSEQDRVFEDKWQKYHNHIARLRILCKECNLSRPHYRP